MRKSVIEWKPVSELPEGFLTVILALGPFEQFQHSEHCDNDHCALAGGPDDCEGVVAQIYPDEAVVCGYHDPELNAWFQTNSLQPIPHTVTHWAHLPEAPQAAQSAIHRATQGDE